MHFTVHKSINNQKVARYRLIFSTHNSDNGEEALYTILVSEEEFKRLLTTLKEYE